MTETHVHDLLIRAIPYRSGFEIVHLVCGETLDRIVYDVCGSDLQDYANEHECETS